MIRIILLVALLTSCKNPPTPGPSPSPTPVSTYTPVPVDSLQRGFTLDSVEQLPKIVTAIKALSWRPPVRLVFDYPEPPSSYTQAVAAICPIATCIGQHSDSVYTGKMTASQYVQRLREYVEAFPIIQIWETCNECNMTNGAATTASAEKADLATLFLKANGKQTMYVPYWNTENCKDKNGEYYEWTSKNISSYVKANTDFVALSVYGFDCDGDEPSHSNLDLELNRLQLLFPNSRPMVGEYGKRGSQQIIRHYLDYRRLGFGGYWYGAQDLMDVNGAMFKEFIK